MVHLLNQRYEIITRLGRGGMGVVYQAADINLGKRFVAVKEMLQDNLKPDEISSATQAFKQEAYMLAALSHQNLPRVMDHFEENNKCYLVMDFIDGKTLADYQEMRGGKLPLGEVFNIGIQLCTVLDYLHTRHPQPIIFRDLKPSNIMRTLDGHIYLIDFGIARLFKGGQTQDTNAGWSVGYSPPEQSPTLYYKQTPPQSDIYSLGATLHHLLTGNKPWLNKPTVFDFPPLSSFDPSFPSALQMLVIQMVEKNTNNRPISVAIIKQNLQEIAGQKVTNPLLSGDSQTFISPHQPPPPTPRSVLGNYIQPIMNTPDRYMNPAPLVASPPLPTPTPVNTTAGRWSTPVPAARRPVNPSTLQTDVAKGMGAVIYAMGMRILLVPFSGLIGLVLGGGAALGLVYLLVAFAKTDSPQNPLLAVLVIIGVSLPLTGLALGVFIGVKGLRLILKRVKQSNTTDLTPSILRKTEKGKILYPRLLFLNAIILFVPALRIIQTSSSFPPPDIQTTYALVALITFTILPILIAWEWVIIYAILRRQEVWLALLLPPFGCVVVPLYLLLNPQTVNLYTPETRGARRMKKSNILYPRFLLLPLLLLFLLLAISSNVYPAYSTQTSVTQILLVLNFLTTWV